RRGRYQLRELIQDEHGWLLGGPTGEIVKRIVPICIWPRDNVAYSSWQRGGDVIGQQPQFAHLPARGTGMEYGAFVADELLQKGGLADAPAAPDDGRLALAGPPTLERGEFAGAVEEPIARHPRLG